MDLYSPEWYATIVEGSRRSAGVIVPMLMDLTAPTSVVDVGCGTGAWLAAFRAAGVRRVLGIDGSYVREQDLLIPPSCFVAADVGEALPVAERFDLCMCLEVAEHVGPECAAGLIAELTRLSEVVMFSAAIPYQGGRGHVNERWPTYWCELFEARGYRVIDAVRPKVWSNRAVEPWYQQNVLLFATDGAIAAHPALGRERAQTRPDFLSVVHPRLYSYLLEREGIKPAGAWLPGHDWERTLERAGPEAEAAGAGAGLER